MRIFLFVSVLMMLSCSEVQHEKAEAIQVEIIEAALVSPLNDSVYEQLTKINIECDEYSFNKMKLNEYDLTIDSQFDYSSLTDSIIRKTESLLLNHINDTLVDITVFKKIKRLKLFSCNNIKLELEGLEELNIIELWLSDLYLNKDQKWIKNIEAIHLDKSFIYGVDSLSIFFNLKYLYFAFSGFKGEILDFNKIKNIQEITFRAYHGGKKKVNLREVDVRNLPCLTKLVINDQLGCLVGVPQNLLKRNWKKIKINNRDLSEKERLVIEELNKIKKRN